MEVYNNVENDVGNAYSYNKITGYEYDKPSHNKQMVCYSIEEKQNVDRSNLINIEISKPTTGNAIKWLQMQQKTYKSNTNAKTTKVTRKQIANQEFSIEKGKMKIQEQVIIEKVGRQFQNMKELAKAQKECFW